MSWTFYTHTITQGNAPAGVAFGMPKTRGDGAARDTKIVVLAERCAG
jgi:hypothetical protein